MERWRRSFPVRQLRARPLACFALAFLLGLLAAYYWKPPLILSVVGCVAISLVAAMQGLKRRRFAALMLLVGLLLGMARMSMALESVPEVATRESALLVGSVVDEPFTDPDKERRIARFQLESVEGTPESLCLRLYLRGDMEALERIHNGQRLSFTGSLWANNPVTNPYEFDFAAYLHRNGMAAMATAKIEDVEILSEGGNRASPFIAAREAVGRRIDALFPENAPLVRALVLGDRSQLSDELRAGLSATGTAHLIAISGLHVTVLAFALALLLGRFMPLRWANLAAVAPLLLFGALIGFTPSFVRALIMFAVLSFAPLVGLYSDSITRLSVALMICLLLWPLNVVDAGLVLSFSASAGILLLMPPIQALFGLVPTHRRDHEADMRKRLHRKAAAFFADLFCASLAAQLMTLPAVVAYFGTQSLVALPVNLICVPLCMAGYVLALAVLLLSVPFLPLAMLLARLPDALFTALLSVTRFSAALPVTGVRIGRYSAPLVLLHGAIALAGSELSRLRLSIRRFVPLALVLVAILSTLLAYAQTLPFKVVFLDAESADCAVVQTQGHTYVFDTGDTYTPVADYLGATCLHLDGVFLSHPHEDHAGGLEDILDAFKPDAIYVPLGWFSAPKVSSAITVGIERARDMGIPIYELAAGDRLPLSDEAEVSVWSPGFDKASSEVNDMSLLTLVTRGEQSVLFTGDLTIQGEPASVPDCDVLKVAHHGADNASSTRFLRAASPEIAIVSVGENNYGHPGAEALRRIEDSGARMLRTDERGAITLKPDGSGWAVKTYLEAPDHDLE